MSRKPIATFTLADRPVSFGPGLMSVQAAFEPLRFAGPFGELVSGVRGFLSLL